MKRILLVVYYWPPAGGSGVQRWMRFVKHLPESGWQPSLIIPKNPQYPTTDPSLLEQVREVDTLEVPIWEPYKLAECFSAKNKKHSQGMIDIKGRQDLKTQLSLWIRGNLFIPDARKFWVRNVVKELKKRLKRESFDALITTGPPHSVHLVGLKIKAHHKELPWLADFQDPWTRISYHELLKLTRATKRKHEQLEHAVFNSADALIAMSALDKKDFEQSTPKPIHIIPNGFERVAFEKPERDKKFSIAHIGGLEMLRNPKMLWEVLEDLIWENPDFKRDLSIELIGNLSEGVKATLSSSQLKDHLHFRGYLDHETARKAQFRARVLLISSFPIRHTAGIIPAKFYEYLQSGNPILAIGMADSALKRRIEETRSGVFVAHGEKQKLKDVLLDFYQQYQGGSLKSQATDIDRFEARELTQTLSQVLEQLSKP